MLPGGKTGQNRTLIDPGPSDADNGKPDLWTGSPPPHYIVVASEKKKKKLQYYAMFLKIEPEFAVPEHK